MNYYYKNNDAIIRIKHHCKPSENNIPKRGTFIVYEFDNARQEFVMPCFPEITWGVLKKLEYLGKNDNLIFMQYIGDERIG